VGGIASRITRAPDDRERGAISQLLVSDYGFVDRPRRADVGHCDVAVVVLGDLEADDAGCFSVERPLACVRIPYPQAALFDISFTPNPIRLADVASAGQVARIV